LDAEPVRRLSITGLGWSDVEVIDVTLMQNLVALSPDGSRLVYSALRDGSRRLYLRELDAFDAQPIKGTENGFGPFLSPDGSSLAFAAEGRLKKLSLAGGLPQAFAAAPGVRGGAWRADGTVFFSPLEFSGLWRASIAGGATESLDEPDPAAGEAALCLPKLLPDGKSVLFTAHLGGRSARVGLYDAATGKSRVLLEDANNVHYVGSGHLVFGRGSEIWAVAFDAARAEVVGRPQRMVEHVWVGGFYYSTLFTASQNGVLAYAPAGTQSGRRSLVWVDRQGRETPITRELRPYAAPRLSPDGKSILVRIAEDAVDIWSYEIERGVLTRLTSEGYEEGPLWAKDGKSFFYPSNRTGVQAIYRQSLAGGEARLLSEAARFQYPETLSHDGKTMLTVQMNPKTGVDIFLLPLDAGGTATPLVVTESSEYCGGLSPDGRWLVYVSRASGRPEVVVRSVAGGAGESRVSLNGGTEPRWSEAGGEIFYREGLRMMAAEVRTHPALQVSAPHPLFEGLYDVMDGPINYDVSPDGRRFLMVKMERSEAPAELRVVTRWDRELRQALPMEGDRP
jgi:serine/threonine-protein kinase